MEKKNFDMIVAIAEYKDEKKVLKAIKASGAPAATYFYGRGTGVKERLGFLGHLIQDEKVVFLTAVPSEKSQEILSSIVRAAELDKPGKGFACTLKLDQVYGFI